MKMAARTKAPAVPSELLEALVASAAYCPLTLHMYSETNSFLYECVKDLVVNRLKYKCRHGKDAPPPFKYLAKCEFPMSVLLRHGSASCDIDGKPLADWDDSVHCSLYFTRVFFNYREPLVDYVGGHAFMEHEAKVLVRGPWFMIEAAAYPPTVEWLKRVDAARIVPVANIIHCFPDDTLLAKVLPHRDAFDILSSISIQFDTGKTMRIATILYLLTCFPNKAKDIIKEYTGSSLAMEKRRSFLYHIGNGISQHLRIIFDGRRDALAELWDWIYAATEPMSELIDTRINLNA
jgi:hypothetical protein